jgi:pSer/pThr/pTyr-binding forkhead associated (FHA) protein
VPYIVIKTNGREIDRRELTGAIVIGRAPDCDAVVRDILLSRRHCQLEQEGAGWKLADLQSKNGTIINGERLSGPRMLRDNDVVRLGRSKIIFHVGMPDEDIAERLLTPARPADPGDSLAGTLSGFTLLLPGEGEIPQNMPCPQPRPKDPPAYGQEELQTLLAAIASSSWDSVYAEARQPIRNAQTEVCEEESTNRSRARPRSPMDFSLQVNPILPASCLAEQPAVVVTVPRRLPRAFGPRKSLHAVVAVLWIMALIVLNIGHKPVARRAMGDQAAVAIPNTVPMDDPIIALGTAADGSKPEIAALHELSTAPTAVQTWPATANRRFRLDAPTAKLAAEDEALYLPLIAW